MFGDSGADSEEEKGVPVWKLQTFKMVAKKKPKLIRKYKKKKKIKAELITALGNTVNNACLCYDLKCLGPRAGFACDE